MNGGHQPTGEWTQVRRRKIWNTELTNYYVTGFPDGTKKEELREPFSRFRKAVDVYFGLKKDYQRRNFAFVRYVGIKDAKVMELKLQGINSYSRREQILHYIHR
ncbi:unnamed protein product [Lactuca virosa]|uniref:RRM domain-containing protein n=1 Tax=Lactuca virosa TaxID=75947 RepID=A0AAU9M5U8_9ASTR|nr:unnamed protein product [Lactuca virosa]